MVPSRYSPRTGAVHAPTLSLKGPRSTDPVQVRRFSGRAERWLEPPVRRKS